jgi:septal ring factor EnvC (AmiA/AmiB activator)
MNLYTKILVVVVLVLSVAFAVSQMMLHAKRVNWLDRYTQTKAKLDDATTRADSLDAQLKDLIRAADEDKLRLETQVAALTTESGAKTSRIADLDREKTKLVADFDEARIINNALVLRTDAQYAVITELKTKGDNLGKELQVALGKIEGLEGNVRAREKEIVGLHDQMAERDKTIKEVTEEKDMYAGTITALMKQGVHVPPPPAPAIDAKVARADNALGTVVLNKGKRDGVKVAHPFTIYRGTEFVAKVVVQQVEDQLCVARVERGLFNKAMMVGDDATTRIQ